MVTDGQFSLQISSKHLSVYVCEVSGIEMDCGLVSEQMFVNLTDSVDSLVDCSNTCLILLSFPLWFLGSMWPPQCHPFVIIHLFSLYIYFFFDRFFLLCHCKQMIGEIVLTCL